MSSGIYGCKVHSLLFIGKSACATHLHRNAAQRSRHIKRWTILDVHLFSLLLLCGAHRLGLIDQEAGHKLVALERGCSSLGRASGLLT